MPKETIVTGQDGARLYVGWRKDSDVQLGVDRKPLDSAGEVVDVWTDNLSRFQINQLIRVLRNARDAAYGRDE